MDGLVNENRMGNITALLEKYVFVNIISKCCKMDRNLFWFFFLFFSHIVGNNSSIKLLFETIQLVRYVNLFQHFCTHPVTH